MEIHTSLVSWNASASAPRSHTTCPGASLTWDDAGNLHNFNKGNISQEFVHDAEGRLVAVNDSTTGSPLLELSCDPLGRVMIHKIHRGKELPSVRFLYDGDECIKELGTDNLADMAFVSADGIKQCISTRNGTNFYPHNRISTPYGNSSGGIYSPELGRFPPLSSWNTKVMSPC